MKTPLFLVALLLLVVSESSATNYYVSNAGSDSNAGTSPSSPFATVGHVNGPLVTLNPGDIVSFQCGGVWREQLLPKSGTSSGRVTYNSYGSGSKPLFLGSVNKNQSSDWTNLGSNIWSAGAQLGANLIADSSFTATNLSTNWQAIVVGPAQGGTAAGTWSRDTNSSTYKSAPASCALAVTNSGGQDIQLMLQSSAFSVINRTVYRLGFWAKCSTPFTMQLPFLSQGTALGNKYATTTGTPPSITTSWAYYTLDYVCNIDPYTTQPDAVIAIRLGTKVPAPSTFEIDDITVQSIDESLGKDVGNVNFNNPSYISNPSFTTDTSGWSLWANAPGGASATLSRDTTVFNSGPASGAVAVSAVGSANSDIQLKVPNLSITNGFTYQFTFSVKATTAFTMTRPSLAKQTSPYTNYSSSTSAFSGNITTSWQTFTITYVANATANDANINTFLGASIPVGATCYFDDVTFTQVTDSPQQIANPSFDANLSGWSFYVNPAVAAATNTRDTTSYLSGIASSKIAVTTSGSSVSDIQFSTSGLSVTSGVVYRLTFLARRAGPNAYTMSLPSLIKQTSPYSNYFSSHSTFSGAITGDWAPYTIDFTANATASDAMIDFFLGNLPAGDQLYLEDVNFKQMSNPVSFDSTSQNSNMGTRQSSLAAVTSQGQFWYDSSNYVLKMYSTANPASLYSTIECAVGFDLVSMKGSSPTSPVQYVTLDGLSFWNAGAHAIDMNSVNYITVRNCDIRFVGGTYQSPNRYGNGIQFYDYASNCLVTNNYISNCYDAGVTNQGGSGGETNTQQYLSYTYNTILCCHYSFEIWDRPTSSKMEYITFVENSCWDAGTSFSESERPPDNTASHLRLSFTNAIPVDHIFIQYNTLVDSTQFLINQASGSFTNVNTSVLLDYNNYTQTNSTNFAMWYVSPTTSSYYSLPDFQNGNATTMPPVPATNEDLHSTLTF